MFVLKFCLFRRVYSITRWDDSSVSSCSFSIYVFVLVILGEIAWCLVKISKSWTFYVCKILLFRWSCCVSWVLYVLTARREKIKKPKPWAHTEPITRAQLMNMREEFWDTSPHYGGQRGVYMFLIVFIWLNLWTFFGNWVKLLLIIRDLGCTSSCCWSWTDTSADNYWQCRRDCSRPWSNIVLGWKRFCKNNINLILVFSFLFCVTLLGWFIYSIRRC